MKKHVLPLVSLLLLANLTLAQYNMELLGKKVYSGMNLSGSWGYTDTVNNKEYALVGTSKGLSIVDITTPATPTEVRFITGSQGSWREAQTWKNFVYITQDNNSNTNSEGVLIYDLSLIPGGKVDSFKGTTPNDLIIKTHSLFIDEKGYLYLNGGIVTINGTNNNGTAIYNLNPDPKHPVFVGFTPSTSQVNYVHDCYARNDVMYQAHIYTAGNKRFTVWDVSNRSNPVKLADYPTPHASPHNLWLSDDSKTLFVSHESFNLPGEAYDVSDLNNITQLCEFRIKAGNQEILHNVHVLNDYIIGSYYSDGVAIFDASEPNNVITIGYYDTQPGTTRTSSGVWGAYGYYRSGLITLSDMTRGLHVVKPTYIRAARLEGLISDSTSGNPITGATISFVDTAISVVSNSEGLYKTGTPKAGTVTIKIEKAGYVTKFVTVTLFNGIKQVLNVPLSGIVTGVRTNHAIDNQIEAYISGQQLVVHSTATSSIKSLELYDITGRVQQVSTASSPQQSLDISAYSKGIYFLRVNFDNNEFAVKKIAVN